MAVRTKAIAMAAVIVFAVTRPAGAQDSAATVTLAGVVRDTSGRLLPGAEVRSGERFTITSDSGTFVLGGLAPDTVELLVRRIGFRPVFTAFVIRPGLTVSVAVRMTPSDVTLGTIVVEGKKVDARLWKTGFYQRAKLGMGTFFTPEQLEHRGSTISGLIAEVPSVSIDRDRMNRAAPMGRFGGGWCQMNVFIDGQLARWATDVGLDDVLPKSEILAVEVYPRVALVPSVLVGSASAASGSSGAVPGVSGASSNSMMTSQGQRSDCGAIFFWTKPFEPSTS
jgi:hypothetical protein